MLDAGLRAQTDTQGRYWFLRVPAGTHAIRAIAVGFEPKIQSLVVPGRSEDYEVTFISKRYRLPVRLPELEPALPP